MGKVEMEKRRLERGRRGQEEQWRWNGRQMKGRTRLTEKQTDGPALADRHAVVLVHV